MSTIHKVRSDKKAINYMFNEIEGVYEKANFGYMKKAFSHEYEMLHVFYKNKSEHGVEDGFIINELSLIT